jgi:hypothetical protein
MNPTLLLLFFNINLTNLIMYSKFFSFFFWVKNFTPLLFFYNLFIRATILLVLVENLEKKKKKQK